MKLYYSPAACSLSPHIVLREAGIAFTLEKVDLQTKKLASGSDFNRINAKSYVPVLELDDGERLTEGPAILQYIADLVPGNKLAPRNGTFERYRLQEWLNFITSELHKTYSPLFRPDLPAEQRKAACDKLASRFNWLTTRLSGAPYLMGQQFTVADAYLFTVLNWSQFTSVDLNRWPVLSDYVARVTARPRVREALKEEGLIKDHAA